MAQFRRVPGARKNREAEPEEWGPEWRIEGTPLETRFASAAEALAKGRAVQEIKPRRLKGRREAKSTRPGPEIAERLHHSKGKKWEKFLESLGMQLSEREQLLLMDGRKSGGSGMFGDWKQGVYKDRRELKSEIFFDTFNGRMVAKPGEDGKMILVPHVETDPEIMEQQEKKRAKQRRAVDPNSRNKFCDVCGVKLPLAEVGKQNCCKTCRPGLSVEDFMKSLAG